MVFAIDFDRFLMNENTFEASAIFASTKPYYFDVADDGRVCYVEKEFLSKVICKNLYIGVQCLYYDVSK